MGDVCWTGFGVAIGDSGVGIGCASAMRILLGGCLDGPAALRGHGGGWWCWGLPSNGGSRRNTRRCLWRRLRHRLSTLLLADGLVQKSQKELRSGGRHALVEIRSEIGG